MQNVLILGAGGFIGSHLVETLSQDPERRVFASDKSEYKLSEVEGDYFFFDLDITDEKDLEEIDDLVSDAQVVLNCAAYANPSIYVEDPLNVFDVNFNANQRIVEMCRKHGAWLIQFSTCEVYGQSAAVIDPTLDDEALVFSEDSPSLFGPVHETRWIYATAKRLLEHTILADEALKWTVIRPFNFMGPRIDFLPSHCRGYAIDGSMTVAAPRVFSCFMDQLLLNGSMKLVDGGQQRRAYTHIYDAVRAVKAILDAPEISQGEIFNIGSPDNEISIVELAQRMGKLYTKFFDPDAAYSMEEVSGIEFYGKGYADCDRRIPDITKIQTLLDWNPEHGLDKILFDSMAHAVELDKAAKS